MRAVKSLILSRRKTRRCGACLFVLEPGATPRFSDQDEDWMTAFATADEYRTTSDNFAKSAARGCSTCVALIAALQAYGANFTTAEFWPGVPSPEPPYLRLVDSNVDFELFTPSGDLFPPGQPSLHPILCKRQLLHGSTGDDDVLATGAQWLAQCRGVHEKCRATDTGFVPTRLLFLAGEDMERVPLVERAASPITYAALSHRWSKETLAARLESGNVAQRRKDGVLLSELPQMLQDAIHVVRRLGISHVWIDCMCIIQDDKDDWRREAATMASIYTYADLTIAATWCTNSSESLFRDRNSRYPAISVAKIEGQPVYLRKALPHFNWIDIGAVRSASDPSFQPEMMWPCLSRGWSFGLEWPLLARGWVYQEHLLSRRILHFTGQELLWECFEATKCECGWHDYGSASEDDHGSYKQPTTTRSWSQVTEEYANRDLTFPSDRLAALAGIAKTFAEFKGYNDSNYLCGLWSDELDETFFWRLDAPADGPRLDIRMPTWSWACVSGAVACESVTLENVEFMSTNVIYHGDPYLGDVDEATLVVSARVAPAVVYYGQEWLRIVDSATPQLRGESNLLIKKADEPIFGVRIGEEIATFSADYKLDAPGTAFIPSGSPVMCLPFSSISSGTSSPKHGRSNEFVSACCLVLYCVDEEKQWYERIGVCTAAEENNFLRLDQVLELSQTKKLTLV